MNMASQTARTATAGFVTLCALAAAALVLISPRQTTGPAPAPAPAAPAPEMIEVKLADVIAAQGNAALRQIRAESTRLTPPDLRDVAVEGESGAAEP